MPSISEINIAGRAQGALLGLACGDAVGTAVEFKLRGTFSPLTGMVGGGPFRLRAGQWTDDTSMALCLGESLLACGGFDARDQMERYLRWFRNGYQSPTGSCFDIGNTVLEALLEFERTGEPFSGSTAPDRAGNGSIMRLAPVVLFFHPDPKAVDHHAAESSRTTHGAEEAVGACRILAGILQAGLSALPKEDLLLTVPTAEWMSPGLKEIAAGGYRGKPREKIRGTGYVVDSLEAALWSFWSTSSFEEAVLAAANLGDDADTTAAVCGQVAGAFYGVSAIPEDWLGRLWERKRIGEMALTLLAGGR
ncbi:MAG: ADP-ribosylglycohydrolase family protein [Longimicrobiales bacterium]